LGRVQIWAAQLWANDFPPICVMTGRPAETWRRFRFATPPQWAYALLILVCLGGLGFIAFAIVLAVVAQRASGYLPLTRSSSTTVSLALWVPVALLIAAPTSWVIAIIAGSSSSDTAAAVFLWLGIGCLLAGIFGRLVVTPLLSPRARVMEVAPRQTDRIVELRNVHPNFVAAVQQQQHARAAQAAAPGRYPFLPASK
jgi:hypothetical protein